MLLAVSALKGLTIAAEDGKIGAVHDFLFDDRTWKLRWLVVDTSGWLSGRKVLIHPSSVLPVDYAEERLNLRLSKQQVKDSPSYLEDEPVSGQMQSDLYGYYGWDPLWGGSNYFGAYPYSVGYPPVFDGAYNDGALLAADRADRQDHADPHLRSVAEITGYHIQATDGTVGHIENMLVETDNWGIRYLVADTRNWWVGKHVLLSPFAVTSIAWGDRNVLVEVTKEKVKASPPWDPASIINRAYQERLHAYYGWPGYGW